MTVCIAAIADNGRAIIGATDQMLSAGATTSDMPMIFKANRIHDRWYASFSGNLNHVPAIMRTVRARLEGTEADISLVSQTFVEAYREYRQLIAEQSILSPFGVSLTLALYWNGCHTGPLDLP
jgi:hypothetical protein